ncbi:MAG: hypothetical protein ACR2RA_14670 [Geminicoccaceae bacterium]
MSPESTKGLLGRDLAPILAFLKQEIDQSAIILRDLAGRLSCELCTLGTAGEAHDLRSSLLAATIALQAEDRVQQRLSDLGATLLVLERILAEDAPIDLDQTIIESLRLEEMRAAFAAGVGMADAVPSPPATAPSIGEIDLF